MSVRGSLVGLVLLVGGTVVACQPRAPFSTETSTATQQVQRLIPNGTTEARAQASLRARGFTFSRLASDQAVNHLLVATCTQNEVTWQIGFVVINGRVAATSVTILK